MRLPRRRPRPRLELLPLIDVVFLILIFLVYAMLSMAAHKGMPVSLPFAQSALAERSEPLALTIQADGSLWLDKEPVNLGNLAGEIRARMKTPYSVDNEGPPIQVFADASLPYQKLYAVLDALRNGGFHKISLQGRQGG